jgi:hypothetical protein
MGGRSVRTEVVHGLEDLYVRVPDGDDTVELSGIPAGSTLCIDRIEAGPLVARTGDDQ